MSADLDIRSVLNLSTAHLRVSTHAWIESDLASHSGLLSGTKLNDGGNGWLLYCCGFSNDPADGLPADLVFLLTLGRKRGCEWLRFDCDLPLTDGLMDFTEDPFDGHGSMAQVKVPMMLGTLHELVRDLHSDPPALDLSGVTNILTTLLNEIANFDTKVLLT